MMKYNVISTVFNLGRRGGYNVLSSNYLNIQIVTYCVFSGLDLSTTELVGATMFCSRPDVSDFGASGQHMNVPQVS